MEFSSARTGFDLGSGGSRLVAAVIAAFRTVVKGGLIPHARHGGRWVVAVAVAGSKFDGTGFENEQMGQIQVALTGLGDGEPCDTVDCGRGDNGWTGWRVED